MGFFTDVGRTVERVKRSVTGDPTVYRCTACGAIHEADHDHCPDCGEAAVLAMETEGEGQGERAREGESEGAAAGPAEETDGDGASGDVED